MTNSGKILVTGGRGKTGSRIAKRLTDLGYAVRTADRGTPAPGSTNKHVTFDWFDETTHEPALKNVDKIYLVGPVAVMDPSKIVLPFVARAVKAGVRRVVLLSSASVPEGGPVFGKVHQALRQLVPEWVVLRPSYFMQNFTEGHHGAQINSDGTMITATGSGRVGFVDADDIAEVGVRALIDEQSHNTDHVITGPQSLSYAEAGEIIGAIAGRTIKHVNISTEELAAGMMKLEMGEDYARFLAGLDEAIRLHSTEDQVTDTVEHITGRPPRSLHDFAVAHASYWKQK
ncbi:MAG TPA: NAD-dependent epimerase/dehydratase family protein [Methylomusa anaerophila]|uniref:NAD(P)H azoreductase n=1 Tax=Methylomusa anaerophila TaxID=1930071 RepID=A0A348ALJ8_9FIRM|nr:NAD-dependent epimerase/dehydratase family protein [Methylomusa anaerophila]BBB91946.1 NAD(P)H azoreductase [Methylomusa anaerophila]HML88042.1 NAD-dependent epimerase/dehydratase family protein [Methylomusa anaerophila]